MRGGWSVRQLDRQIGSQFYERTALSKNKAAMLTSGRNHSTGDAARPEEEIKDPFVLEFLDLKDEYSESDLEEGSSVTYRPSPRSRNASFHTSVLKTSKNSRIIATLASCIELSNRHGLRRQSITFV